VWNTVSGVVIGIAGAIYGAVWTAVTAATQFLKQLGAGLAHLAEDAEQAVVSVVTAVAAALEAALQALENYVINAIEKLVSAAISVVTSAMKGYLTSMASATTTFVEALAGFNSVGSFTTVFSDFMDVILSMLGLGGFAQSLSNLLGTVMNVLQPVLDVLKPDIVLNTIAKTMGAVGLGGVMGSIEAFTSGIRNLVFSALYSGFAGIMSLAGISDKILSTSLSPLPTATDADSFGDQFGIKSGDQNINNAISSLPPDPSGLTVIDWVRVVGSLLVMYYILFFSPRDDLWVAQNVPIAGPFIEMTKVLQLKPAVANALILEGFGLALGVIGALLSTIGADILDRFTLAIAGALLSAFTLGNCAFGEYVGPSVFPSLCAPPPNEETDLVQLGLTGLSFLWPAIVVLSD
jgi:hypothetical protein